VKPPVEVKASKSSVEIIEPVSGGQVGCDNASSEPACRFSVRGPSNGLNPGAGDTIVVFLSPIRPSGGGWWMQSPPAAIEPDGKWSQSPSWLGAPGFPARTGDVVALQAAIVRGGLPAVGARHVGAVQSIEAVVAVSRIVEVPVNRQESAAVPVTVDRVSEPTSESSTVSVPSSRGAGSTGDDVAGQLSVCSGGAFIDPAEAAALPEKFDVTVDLSSARGPCSSTDLSVKAVLVDPFGNEFAWDLECDMSRCSRSGVLALWDLDYRSSWRLDLRLGSHTADSVQFSRGD
jgi:hypothetical protein